MRVYIVIEDWDDAENIEGVFLSREKAEEYAKKRKTEVDWSDSVEYNVQEHEVLE